MPTKSQLKSVNRTSNAIEKLSPFMKGKGGLVFPNIPDKGASMEEIIQNGVISSLNALEEALIQQEIKVLSDFIEHILRADIDKATKSKQQKDKAMDGQISSLLLLLPTAPNPLVIQSKIQDVTQLGAKSITDEEMRLSGYNSKTIAHQIQLELTDTGSGLSKSIQEFRTQFIKEVAQPLYEALQKGGGAVYDVDLVNEKLVKQYHTVLMAQGFDVDLKKQLAKDNNLSHLGTSGLRLTVNASGAMSKALKQIETEKWEDCTLEHSVAHIQDKLLELDVDFMEELNGMLQENKTLISKFCDTTSRPFKVLTAFEKDLIPEKWEKTMMGLLEKIPAYIEFILNIHRELCTSMSRSFVQLKYVVNEDIMTNANKTYQALNTLCMKLLDFPIDIQSNMLKLEQAIKEKKEKREVEQSQSSHYISGIAGSIFSAIKSTSMVVVSSLAYESRDDDPESNDNSSLLGGLNYGDHSTTVLFRIEKASSSFGSLITGILDAAEVIANTPGMSPVFYKISDYYQPLTESYSKMLQETIAGHQNIYEVAYKELENFFKKTGGVQINAIGISSEDLSNRMQENIALYSPKVYDSLIEAGESDLQKTITTYLTKNNKQEDEFNQAAAIGQLKTLILDHYLKYDKLKIRQLNLDAVQLGAKLKNDTDYKDLAKYILKIVQQHFTLDTLSKYLASTKTPSVIPPKHNAAVKFAVEAIEKYCHASTEQFSDIDKEIQFIISNKLESTEEKINKLIFLENTVLNIFEKNSKLISEFISFSNAFILDFHERNLSLERTLKAYKRTEAAWNIIKNLGHGAIGVFFLIHPVNMGVIVLLGASMEGLSALMKYITYRKSDLGNQQDVNAAYDMIEMAFKGVPELLRGTLKKIIQQQTLIQKNILETYKLLGKSVKGGSLAPSDSPSKSPQKAISQVQKDPTDPYSQKAFEGMFEQDGDIGISLESLESLPEKLEKNKAKTSGADVLLTSLPTGPRAMLVKLGVAKLVDVLGDGNCLYRAFAQSLFGNETQGNAVGKSLISFCDMMLAAMAKAKASKQFLSFSQFADKLNNQQMGAVIRYFNMSKTNENAFPLDPNKADILKAYKLIVSKGAYFNGGGDLMPRLLSLVTNTRLDIINHAGNLETFGAGSPAQAVIYRQPNHFQAATGKGNPELLTYPTDFQSPVKRDPSMDQQLSFLVKEVKRILGLPKFFKNITVNYPQLHQVLKQLELSSTYFGEAPKESLAIEINQCLTKANQVIKSLYLEELAAAVKAQKAPLNWWVNETDGALNSSYVAHFKLKKRLEDYRWTVLDARPSAKKVPVEKLGALQQNIDKEITKLVSKKLGESDPRTLYGLMASWVVSSEPIEDRKHLNNLTDFLEAVIFYLGADDMNAKKMAYQITANINLSQSKTQVLMNKTAANLFINWQQQLREDYHLLATEAALK